MRNQFFDFFLKTCQNFVKIHLKITQIQQILNALYEREIYGELDGDDDWEEVQMSSLVSTKVEIKGRSTV